MAPVKANDYGALRGNRIMFSVNVKKALDSLGKSDIIESMETTNTVTANQGAKTMTNSTNIITGREAIEYAEANGLKLNKYADPIEGARDDVLPEDAYEICNEDPTLIWIRRVEG